LCCVPPKQNARKKQQKLVFKAVFRVKRERERERKAVCGHIITHEFSWTRRRWGIIFFTAVCECATTQSFTDETTGRTASRNDDAPTRWNDDARTRRRRTIGDDVPAESDARDASRRRSRSRSPDDDAAHVRK
jgi:hypothetical protein|tara:strand:- start:1108 stop:1506 length:399 start_codon:yes stop_codon:yes gene_type:complete